MFAGVCPLRCSEGVRLVTAPGLSRFAPGYPADLYCTALGGGGGGGGPGGCAAFRRRPATLPRRLGAAGGAECSWGQRGSAGSAGLKVSAAQHLSLSAAVAALCRPGSEAGLEVTPPLRRTRAGAGARRGRCSAVERQLLSGPGGTHRRRRRRRVETGTDIPPARGGGGGSGRVGRSVRARATTPVPCPVTGVSVRFPGRQVLFFHFTSCIIADNIATQDGTASGIRRAGYTGTTLQVLSADTRLLHRWRGYANHNAIDSDLTASKVFTRREHLLNHIEADFSVTV